MLKNRRKMIQKGMAIMAVSAMIAGVTAPAFIAKAEDNTNTITKEQKGIATGLWYGNVSGMDVTLNIEDGGTYWIDFEGRNRETGTWTMNGGDNLITDKGSEAETTYTFNGDSLVTKVDGEALKLTKDASNAQDSYVANTDVTSTDFDGVWKADKVDIGKLSVKPSTFGMNAAFVKIKNNQADIYINCTALNKPLQAENLSGTLKNDTGTLEYTIEKKGKTFTVVISKTEDESLSCTLKVDDYKMNIHFEKSTEEEMNSAKKTDSSESSSESQTAEDTYDYVDADGTSTAVTKDIKPGTVGAVAHTDTNN